MAAILDDMQPYAVTAAAVAVCGTPAELAVPIVRHLCGQADVSVGPALMNLIHGMVAVGVARYSVSAQLSGSGGKTSARSGPLRDTKARWRAPSAAQPSSPGAD